MPGWRFTARKPCTEAGCSFVAEGHSDDSQSAANFDATVELSLHLRYAHDRRSN